jgi:hypothetical protein
MLPESRFPIPLPGRKVWYGDSEPHFFMLEKWGFSFTLARLRKGEEYEIHFLSPHYWANYQIMR